MTYDEFVAFVSTFLWKENDASLTNSLPSLVKLATAELNRKLVLNRRERSYVFVPNTNYSSPLPADFRQIISVNSNGTAGRSYSHVSETRLLEMRDQNDSNLEYGYFTIIGQYIHWAEKFDTDNTRSYVMVYRDFLPDYEATGASWVADEYLDLYLYAVLKQTAPFLREDERVVLWQNAFNDALMSALEEDAFEIQHGGQDAAPLTRVASVRRA